jgi:peptidyl-prolyl cis-trans isomerase C
VDENNAEEAARAAIAAAEAELKAGDAFADVAERHSDCKGNGGGLGFIPRGEMVPEFEDVVFALEPGAVSGVFRSPFGFHIATVKARKPAGALTFNEVESQIEETLFRNKKERALENYVDRLKAKAVIES